MPHSALVAFCTLHLLTIAAAQAAGGQPTKTPKAAVFTLPAGQHSVAELINLLGQIRKCEIHHDPAELDDNGDHKIVLQRELQLDGDAFEDVVTTILFYRQLMVVPGDKPPAQRAIAMKDAEELRRAASARTADEILSRPSRAEFVSTTLPPGPVPDVVRINMLRPFFANAGRPSPWQMNINLVDDKIQLTGTTEQLAFALNIVGLLSGDAKRPSSPAIAWRSTEPLPWPGGKMPLTALMKLFTDTLDANLIGEPSDREVDLGARAQLPAAEWFARATAVVRSIDEVIVPVVHSHRVFLLRSLANRGADEVMWRSSFESPEEVSRATSIVPVITEFVCKHARANEAMRAVRPILGRPLSTMILGAFSAKNDRLLISGLRNEVAEVLDVLRKADQPK